MRQTNQVFDVAECRRLSTVEFARHVGENGIDGLRYSHFIDWQRAPGLAQSVHDFCQRMAAHGHVADPGFLADQQMASVMSHVVYTAIADAEPVCDEGVKRVPLEQLTLNSIPVGQLMRPGCTLEEMAERLRGLWAAWPRIVRAELYTDYEENEADQETISVSSVRILARSDGSEENRGISTYIYVHCPESTRAWQEIMGHTLVKVWREKPSARKDALSFDAETLVLLLSSGRYMMLNSSECAMASA